jgi:biopolymer transport protein TolQ
MSTWMGQVVEVSGAIGQGVLYLLAALALISWVLILKKMSALSRARRKNEKFLTLFNASDTIGQFRPPALRGRVPLAAIFSAAAATLQKADEYGVRHVPLSPARLREKVRLWMRHAAREQLDSLRRGIGLLATIGHSSPLIGLFATVFGIIAAFHSIADAKTAGLSMLAPGIASALIATAAGLAVAIPAIMALNAMQGRIERLAEEANAFIERMDLMIRAERAAGAPDEDEPVMASIDR